MELINPKIENCILCTFYISITRVIGLNSKRGIVFAGDKYCLDVFPLEKNVLIFKFNILLKGYSPF